MKFDPIDINKTGGGYKTVCNRDAFQQFLKDYDITGVSWGSPAGMTADLLEDKLLHGHTVTDDIPAAGENSDELYPWYERIFDHNAMWQARDGKIYVTAFPHTEEPGQILKDFAAFKEQQGWPENITMTLLEPKYAYRRNGKNMVLIQAEPENS